MTDRLRDAAQAAIEALERARAYVYETDRPQVDDAMDRLRAALAEPHHHGDSESMCWCDRQKIGEPGVSCGDCPTRDYKKPDQMRDATEMIDDRLRIKRLVRVNARLEMVIDIIKRLLEDPEREDFGPSDMEYWNPLHDALREKLRTALAEQDGRVQGWKLVPEQPTEEMLAATSWPGCAATDYAHMISAAPAPPRRKWQGLTVEEIVDLWAGVSPVNDDDVNIVELGRAIERALKERNA